MKAFLLVLALSCIITGCEDDRTVIQSTTGLKVCKIAKITETKQSRATPDLLEYRLVLEPACTADLMSSFYSMAGDGCRNIMLSHNECGYMINGYTVGLEREATPGVFTVTFWH